MYRVARHDRRIQMEKQRAVIRFYQGEIEIMFRFVVIVLLITIVALVAAHMYFSSTYQNKEPRYYHVEGYTLTQNDTDEGRILAICIETDIQLDYCNFIYGGKNYGDKLQ